MELQPIIVSPDRCEYDTPSGLRLIVDWINPDHNGIKAWCEARWKKTNEVLGFAKLDLMGPNTYDKLSKLTHQSLPVDGIELATVREEWKWAIYDVIRITRLGEETVDLTTVKATSKRWLLPPLMEAGAHTRLIAKGGEFKSLFALAVAVTVATGSNKLLGIKPTATGPVLYLDWEADPQTHAERLHALCKGAGITVAPGLINYEHHRQSLYRGAHAIAGKVAELHPLMVVVDSNAMARGISGEGAQEDSTLRMFSALRSFGAPALIVDHKSSEAITRKKEGGYGSIFNRNLARLEWEVVRSQNGGDSTMVAMRLLKANNTRHGQELGFRYTISTDEKGLWDEATVEKIEPEEVQQPGGSATPNALRIAHWLAQQSEAKSVAQIAVATRLSSNQVRAAISAARGGTFENVGSATGGGGRGGLWRLVDVATDDGEQDALPDPWPETQ